MTQVQLMEYISNHPFLVIALVVVVVMVIANEAAMFTTGGTSLIPQMAVNLYNQKDALFIDTRSDADYDKGHIADAVHFPASYAEERLDTLEKHKQKPLILYSQNGMDIQSTIKLLKNNGFDEVYELKGGLSAWVSDNMPIQKRRKK
mgnify:CR=1 FL=1